MRVEAEDYQILKDPSPIDVGIILHFMKNWWKNAIISDAQGRLLKITEANMATLFQDREFVIYKNAQAVLAWESEGYSPKNSKTALLVMLEDDSICFTFNSSKASYHFISQLEQAILNNADLIRLKPLAERKAS